MRLTTFAISLLCAFGCSSNREVLLLRRQPDRCHPAGFGRIVLEGTSLPSASRRIALAGRSVALGLRPRESANARFSARGCRPSDRHSELLTPDLDGHARCNAFVLGLVFL